ncbi:MAG: hypothetical protein HY848_11955 [Betaproteobacteria bacterium]|nr:hypothetical protein [Betaproteobacteria bacterium]
MKRFFSALFGFSALAFYWLGFAVLAAAHVYTTILAYQYVYAWKVSRALLWIMLTFFVPVLSTIYWLLVHWLQTAVFWNWLTLACATGIACIAAGALCEVLKQRTSA